MQSPSRQAVRTWNRRALGHLSSYRPQFRDWRFWVIVGLVALVAIGHNQFEDGDWLLIRFSGTEPVIRVYCETTHRDKVQDLLGEGLKIAGLPH